MLFFSRERHCGGGVQACRHKMTEKPITDIARVAAFGGEFSSYPWMPQSKSVCEELHAASASRMSLRWLVFRQASEAFSSSSRALRLAVPHLFHCWKSVTWYIGLHRSYLACGVQWSVHAAQREKHYVLKVGHAVAQKITQIQSRTKWGLIFQSLLKSVCEQSHFRQVCVLKSWHSFNF